MNYDNLGIPMNVKLFPSSQSLLKEPTSWGHDPKVY